MSASFFKRLTSAIVDFIIVIMVTYLAFIVGGKTLLQNRVDNFDEVYGAYTQILTAYNDDLQNLQTEYDANIELANGDADLEAFAAEDYNAKSTILNQQNTIDIEPFNEPLTQYYMEIIYFFSIGMIVIMALLVVATSGKTLGRRLMKIKLITENNGESANPNLIQVFFHDIILKYFFIILVFTISMYYGFILILIALLVDIVLISLSRKKSTIRDYFLRMRVVNFNH
ncbi:RDD family protein [Mycoplasmatota bacterium WC30]